MLFTCCHPALAPEARMALTLRSVAGLTVPEIARAFLSSESAMERRLGRARRKVTDARIPFRVPADDLLAERLAGVLRVVYLIYTEGHAEGALIALPEQDRARWDAARIAEGRTVLARAARLGPGGPYAIQAAIAARHAEAPA